MNDLHSIIITDYIFQNRGYSENPYLQPTTDFSNMLNSFSAELENFITTKYTTKTNIEINIQKYDRTNPTRYPNYTNHIPPTDTILLKSTVLYNTPPGLAVDNLQFTIFNNDVTNNINITDFLELFSIQDNFIEKDIFTSFSKSFKNITKFINQRIKFVPPDSYLYEELKANNFVNRNFGQLNTINHLHPDNTDVNNNNIFSDTFENYFKLNYKLYKFLYMLNNYTNGRLYLRAPQIVPRINGIVQPNDIDFKRLYSCYKLQYILQLEHEHELLYNLTAGVNNNKIIQHPTDIVDLFNYYGISGNNYNIDNADSLIVIQLSRDAYNPDLPLQERMWINEIQHIINELDYCFQIYLNFIDNIYTHILHTLKISSKQRNIGLSAIKKIRDILKYTTKFTPKPLDQQQIYHQTKLQDIISEILPKKLNSLNLRPYIQRIFIKINDTISNL